MTAPVAWWSPTCSSIKPGQPMTGRPVRRKTATIKEIVEQQPYIEGSEAWTNSKPSWSRRPHGIWQSTKVCWTADNPDTLNGLVSKQERKQ